MSHAPHRSPYQTGLERTPANHLPLTPLGFLDRSAQVHPDGIAVVHAGRTQTWAQTRERAYRLASALVQRGVQRGDTVAILAPNTPALLDTKKQTGTDPTPTHPASVCRSP